MDRGLIVVVGFGNILLGDEGVGVHAVRLLQKRFPHHQATYYDGGTLGLTLLPLMEEASHLLLLDAVRTKGNPGAVVEFPKDRLLASFPLKFSAHDIGLHDLLALLRLRVEEQLTDIFLLGVIPSSFALSTDLSPEVEAALPELMEKAEGILRGWIAQINSEDCTSEGEGGGMRGESRPRRQAVALGTSRSPRA